MVRIAACALACACLAASQLCAQQAASPAPIDTDRPDLTDGTGTLARGRVQLESGFTLQTSRDGRSAISVPELLIRVGVASRAEVRVSQNYLSLEDSPGVRTNGFGDLLIGTKVRVAEQHALPAVSVEAFTTVATGAAQLGADRMLPGAALLLQRGGDGPWSAGIEVQVSRAVADSGRSVASDFTSLSVQYQATPRLQGYAEWYQLQPDLAAGTHQHYADAGALFLLSSDVQIDGRVGFGLNHDADRYYFGVGFSVRH